MAEPICRRSSSTAELCSRGGLASQSRVEARVDLAIRDVRAVAEAQERLLRVVEDISEELSRLGAVVAEGPGSRTPARSPGRGVRWTGVEDPRERSPAAAGSNAPLLQRLERQEAALVELRRGCAEDSARHGAAIDELLQGLQQLHEGGSIAAALTRHESEIAELRMLREDAAPRRNADQWEPPRHFVEQLDRHEAAIVALQDIPSQLQHLEDLQREIVEVSRLDREAAAVPEARLEDRFARLETEHADVQRLLAERPSRQEADVSGQVARLDASIAELDRTHWERLSKHEAAASERLAHLDAAVSALQRSQAEKTPRQEGKVLAQVARLEEELAEAGAEMAKLRAEVAEVVGHGADVHGLQGRLEELAEEFARARHAEEEALAGREEASEGRFSSLEAAVAEAHHLLAEKFAKEDAEPLAQQVSQIQESLAEVQQAYDDKSTRQEALTQHIANMEELISEVQRTCGEKISRHEADVSMQVSRLRGELVELQCTHTETARRREPNLEQLSHLSTRVARHDAELGALKRLPDDVERHEGAIADLQGQTRSVASTSSAEVIMDKLEVWEGQLRSEFMAMHRQLVPELLAEVRAQLSPAARASLEPAAGKVPLDERRSVVLGERPRTAGEAVGQSPARLRRQSGSCGGREARSPFPHEGVEGGA